MFFDITKHDYYMKKILVIEDNLEVRENIVEILELSGYEVVAVPDGKQGVEMAMQEKPDLILCDVMMPELDGFGVLRILGKNKETRDIPFIFLTAKTEQADFRKGMGLGADDYITKPFDDVELLDAIEIRLTKKEQLAKTFDGSGRGLSNFFDQARADEALRKLSEDREERFMAKRSMIFEEGRHANWLYFLASGKVKCYKTNDYGKELITHIYKEGDFFGFLPLIQDHPYEESAMVIEDAVLHLIPKEDFNMLLYHNRGFSLQFIKMLANEVSAVEEDLLKLAYDSVRLKVSKTLLALFDKYDQNGTARISILREDLASMSGTAKETVIRTLTDFKEEKLIEIKGNEIIISDRNNLEKLRF